MEKRFEKLIYATLLLLLISAGSFAQPFRKLTTSDFKGIPNAGNGEDVAFTNCTIIYTYTARPENDYYVLSFNVQLVMNSNQSWIDRRRVNTPAMVAEILKHEQGHYNIAYLEQQELLKTVAHTVFRSNYKAVANAIFDRIDAKYKQINSSYDNDTGNSTNRVQQHSWDVYFDKTISSILRGRNYYAAVPNNEDAEADNR